MTTIKSVIEVVLTFMFLVVVVGSPIITFTTGIIFFNSGKSIGTGPFNCSSNNSLSYLFDASYNIVTYYNYHLTLDNNITYDRTTKDELIFSSCYILIYEDNSSMVVTSDEKTYMDYNLSSLMISFYVFLSITIVLVCLIGLSCLPDRKKSNNTNQPQETDRVAVSVIQPAILLQRPQAIPPPRILYDTVSSNSGG